MDHIELDLASKEMASMRRVIFLPHLGEFGWFIARCIRRIHQYAADEKIVCCEKGQEVYFPSASGFVYDWEQPVPEHDRRGIGNQYECHAPIKKLKERLHAEFPEHEVISNETLSTFGKFPDAKEWSQTFPLNPTKRGLKTDLVFGARNRAKVETVQNWDGWPKLADAVISVGHSFAVIGKRGSTRELPGAKHHSWDFDDASADVELLQNCRLYVGGNSGVTHLATFLQVPTIAACPGWPGGEWLEYMRYTTKAYFEHLPNRKPEHVIERTLKYFESTAVCRQSLDDRT